MPEFNTPISRLPLGLLGLLDTKTSGSYPSKLIDTYQPVLDLMQLIGSANAKEVLIGTGNFNALGANALGATGSDFKVPSREIWYVRGCSLSAGPTLAGENIRMSMLVVNNLDPANRYPMRNLGYECSSSLTDAVGVGFPRCVSTEGFFMFGNDQICCDIHRITTAGTIGVTGTAQILRFLQ